MASVSGSILSPANGSVAMGQAVTNFLTTGSLTPTTSTPAFRAGSTASYTNASCPSTAFNVPISASVVTGDFILFCCKSYVNTAAAYPTPAGFITLAIVQGNEGYFNYIGYKIATATDPGSNISWNLGATSAPGASIAVVTLSYSGVSGIIPALINTALGASATTHNAPVLTTTAASVVTEVFFATGGAGITLTGPTTQRISAAAAAGTNAVCVSEQTQGAAGSTGTQTCTASLAATWGSITLVWQGQPTGGTPPPGGWTLVDSYTNPTSPATMNLVYQSPGASNNLGTTWYLIFQITLTPGSMAFAMYACEVYNTANHTYNAAVFSCGSTNPFAPSGSAGTPPYALVAGSPNNPGTFYSSMMLPTYTLVNGTNNFMMAANRDGFFLDVLAAGQVTNCAFFGAGTSLITNPNLTPYELPLFGMTWYPSPQAGVSREPGSPTAVINYWGYYIPSGFMPGTGFALNTLTGGPNLGNGDLFLAPGVPLATRWFMVGYSSRTVTTQGCVRGLLPSWLQYMPQSGCTWGDTVTEGADTLTFAGTSSYATTLWVDTTAA